jgi:hypothetical protein
VAGPTLVILPLNHENVINNIEKISSSATGNTLRLRYKNQIVNDVHRNN